MAETAESLQRPGLSALSEADQQRRAALLRMRVIATGLLVLAAFIFIGTLKRDGAWGFVNAMAEAAMVGAMADWFAVTALFRHPLGLPIPHTALVPRRKAEFGRSLQDFFAQHFLTERIARERLAVFRPVERVGHWLQVPANQARLTREVVSAGRDLVARLPDEQVRSFAADIILPRLAEEPVAELAGDLLEAVITDQAHSGLIDLVSSEVHGWLVENPDAFKEIVGERAPWWTPAWVDEKVIDWAYTQAVAWVDEIHHDQQHPTRKALDEMLLRLAVDLQNDPEVAARAEALKARLLTHPQVPDTVVSLWRAGRAALQAMADDPNSLLYRRGEELAAETGNRLLADDALRERLDALLGDGIGWLVRNYGEEISTAISYTIDTWDGKDAANLIELHVGRDLQFIRINGTVVGALVGLIIHTVVVLVG